MHKERYKFDIGDRIGGGIVVAIVLYIFSLFGDIAFSTGIRILIAIVGGVIFAVFSGNLDKFWDDISHD